ncbi:LysR family transcriptional regulator, partial [Rhodococcus hoagii]|nr:LysR family transcriptional regulator [Prescottella equi]
MAPSRPAVASQSIQTLERDLGAPLFHRVGRGLVPTAVGTALVAPHVALARCGDGPGLRCRVLRPPRRACRHRNHRRPLRVTGARAGRRTSADLPVGERAYPRVQLGGGRCGGCPRRQRRVGVRVRRPRDRGSRSRNPLARSEELCIALPRRIAGGGPRSAAVRSDSRPPVIAVTVARRAASRWRVPSVRSARRTAIGVVRPSNDRPPFRSWRAGRYRLDVAGSRRQHRFVRGGG